MGVTMFNAILTALALVVSQPTLTDLEDGQVWTMNAPGYTQTLITIGPRQTDLSGFTVAHIAISNLPAPPSGHAPEIGHLPVDADQVLAALGEQVSDGASLESIRYGMAIWEEDNGGVFTISVPEIIETVIPAGAAELAKKPK